MKYTDIKKLVFDTALELSRRGPGWAQERPVLNEVRHRIGFADDQTQQLVLTCWHDLFRTGRLSWGYNLDNPNAPFFHVPSDDAERDMQVAESARS
jgi:hypothetical protein